MTPLVFDAAKCVRSVSKFSGCTACATVCPTGAVTLSETGISIDLERCTACAGCVAACPTQALDTPAFSAESYVMASAAGDGIVACKRGDIPCGAALGVEHLIALALHRGGGVTIDTGHCAGCALETPSLSLINDRCREASAMLEALGSPWRAGSEMLAIMPDAAPAETEDRRGFLSRLSLAGLARTKKAFDGQVEGAGILEYSRDSGVDPASLRAKSIPARRALFYSAVKGGGPEGRSVTMSCEEVSFISDKTIDAPACTNCGICHRLCPTGALSTGKWGAEIFFNPLACVKCSLCHDACETQCLHVAETFDTGYFFAPVQNLLIRHTVRRCVECGMIFKYEGGDALCPRCLMQDDEARELLGF